MSDVVIPGNMSDVVISVQMSNVVISGNMGENTLVCGEVLVGTTEPGNVVTI